MALFSWNLQSVDLVLEQGTDMQLSLSNNIVCGSYYRRREMVAKAESRRPTAPSLRNDLKLLEDQGRGT